MSCPFNPAQFPSGAPAIALAAAIQKVHLDAILFGLAFDHLYQMALGLPSIEEAGDRGHGVSKFKSSVRGTVFTA